MKLPRVDFGVVPKVKNSLKWRLVSFGSRLCTLCDLYAYSLIFGWNTLWIVDSDIDNSEAAVLVDLRGLRTKMSKRSKRSLESECWLPPDLFFCIPPVSRNDFCHFLMLLVTRGFLSLNCSEHSLHFCYGFVFSVPENNFCHLLYGAAIFLFLGSPKEHARHTRKI